MITLTIISTTALIVQHDHSVQYQRRIDQTIKQLESEKTAQHEQMLKQLQNLEQLNTDKDKQIQDLNTQLQAKKQQQSLLARAVNVIAPAAYASGDSDKLFIYMHESGNNPGAINASSGACGLGQALPCSKMPCSLSDYVCQDNFFTQYMLGRYGSWANAKSFWIAHRWW